MGSVVAAALIRADNRKLKGDLAKSKSLFHRTFGGISKGIKGSLGGALGMVGAGGAALGFAAIGKQVLDFEDALNRIAIQAGMTTAETEALRQNMIRLSKETGISRSEIVGAATSLINLTGDIEFTKGSLEVLAKANLATGASMEELAGLAFSLQKSFKLVDANSLMTGLSAIVTAGKQGAIPLGEMSLILQQLSASFSSLGGQGVDGISNLAAALQVLRPAFGSASEAGTGLQNMMTAFKKKSDKLEKNGIKIFESDGNGGKKFRELNEILDDIAASDLMKNPDLLVKVLGTVEAEKAMVAWTKGREQYELLAGAARKSNAVQVDSDKRRESAAFRMQKAVNDAKEAVADAFTPERIKTFVTVLEKAANVLKFMIDHAKAFVAVWATFKLASLVSGFAAMAASQAAQAASAQAGVGHLNGMNGLVGKIGAGLQGLGIGLAAGTAIDQAFGISDKIGEMGLNKTFKYEGSLGSRKGSKKLNSQAYSRMAGVTGFGVDNVKSKDILSTSRNLLGDARANNTVDDTGRVDRRSAFMATHDVSTGSLQYNLANSNGFNDSKTEALVSALQQALTLEQETAKLRANAKERGLSGTIEVKVDEKGLLHAFGKYDQDARRSPQ